MEYKNLSVQQATAEVIAKIGKLGGDGGMIALDRQGNAAMTFNTEGMYRGTVSTDGTVSVSIYK